MDGEGCLGAFIGFCIFVVIVVLSIEQLYSR